MARGKKKSHVLKCFLFKIKSKAGFGIFHIQAFKALQDFNEDINYCVLYYFINIRHLETIFKSSSQNATNAFPHGLLLPARLNVTELEKKSSSVSGVISHRNKPTNVMFYDSSCWNLSTAGPQWTSIGAACLEDDFKEVEYWPDFFFFFFPSDVNKAFFDDIK